MSAPSPLRKPEPERAPDFLAPLVDKLRTSTRDDLMRSGPPETGSREAAVLVLVGESAAGPDVLLTQRSSTMRNHRGQVSFPGGSTDPGDGGSIGTALREAEEEVGLDPTAVHPLSVMPDLYIPRSGFAVVPVLAWADGDYEVHVREPAEVARVERVPISALVDPAHRFTVTHPMGYRGPAFEVDGLFIWGFTAGVLDRLLDLGGFASAWDETTERLLPERYMR
ncbi:8-oxo-dGTP pyrophosphatase MutT (NUDIX family) [Antricoccus suffuscus]|uniref:8-oxo-dGTP pyrophosphatase MutT (NUDIX family) n=1 Tax=Antricoccus suffuscus TaxID=1629062 RepID=A0A2T1A3A9_9ACTN|nr:CoA pyrophosphatase [Antricoccus suffuscus]PRZ43092.1 8-oxo-dGTP pyrophosphatase MutT (NUDIX family) [Antricoccus suffuscus]